MFPFWCELKTFGLDAEPVLLDAGPTSPDAGPCIYIDAGPTSPGPTSLARWGQEADGERWDGTGRQVAEKEMGWDREMRTGGRKRERYRERQLFYHIIYLSQQGQGSLPVIGRVDRKRINVLFFLRRRPDRSFLILCRSRFYPLTRWLFYRS